MLVKYTIVFSLVIDITKELRNCRADNKAAKIKEVNEEEKLTRVVPSKIQKPDFTSGFYSNSNN